MCSLCPDHRGLFCIDAVCIFFLTHHLCHFLYLVFSILLGPLILVLPNQQTHGSQGLLKPAVSSVGQKQQSSVEEVRKL